MRNFGCLCAALLAFSLAGSAQAQTQDREREALRRMQQQMQKLQQSNAALEKEKAELTKRATDAEAVGKENEALRSQNAGLRRDAGQRVSALEKRLAESREAVAKLQAELAESRKTGGAQRAEIDKLRAEIKTSTERVTAREGTLKERESTLEVCSNNNTVLVQRANEVLDRLSDGRCRASSDFRWDPFTKLGRVKFENELERYRGLIADQRFVRERAK